MRTLLWAGVLLMGCGGGVAEDWRLPLGELTDAGQPAVDAGSAGSDAGGPMDGGAAEADAGPELRPDAGSSSLPDAGAGLEDPGPMTSAARVITADGTEFVVDQVGAALDHALLNSPTRHVIFYVHGRACGGGGEPTKSLSGAVPELESDYHSKVLMFTWPGSSSGCPLGFPESEARASGTALNHTLHKLAFTLHARAATLGNVTLTLVTHSLGNIVLEEALAHEALPLPPTLFDTVVLSSSATALAAHRAWLTELRFSLHVYVSVNDGDSVLTSAGLGRGTRLGKKLGNEPLAPNARYVDFTAAGVNHAYYLHTGQKGAHMRGFYDTVMEGRPYDFAASNALTRTEARDGTFVYVFDGS